jgi:hypothetical protein
MAIEDALKSIDRSWPDIEPRLTVRELASIAGLQPGPRTRTAELSETVFRLLAPALPADHPAWSALRSSATRFVPGPQGESLEEVIGRCIDRARTAIARPWIADDAAADFLVDSMIRRIVGAGVLVRDQFDGIAPLEFEYEGQRLYPRFQFAATRPAMPHEIVSRMNGLLGGDEDPIGAISWWLLPNAWLGRAPAELLGSGRDADIEYAASQLANDSW